MKRITALLLVLLLLGACAPSIEVYRNPEKPLNERVEDLLARVTLEEKISMISGKDFWHIQGIERLSIPDLQVTDCGHGVTIILEDDGNWSGEATCFPTAVGQAATWSTDLIKEMGAALGRETRATGSSMLLAPMVNIKRHPLNGRNYETFSEDPLLSGKMASAFIQGIQSQDVGAVIKGMTANNQQADQHDLYVEMDERTLREIYLPSFEIPVREANPWGVMTAYNGLNGHRTSDYEHILQEILKDEWGYEGFVISDWGAVKSTESMYTGLDLEFPGPGKFLVPDSVNLQMQSGQFSEDMLDEKVRRILRAVIRTKLLDTPTPELPSELNSDYHQELARRVAEESIILMKNDEQLLPLDKTKIRTLAVIGPNANQARLGGGGSASVNPFYSVSPLEGLRNYLGDDVEILYAEGCGLNGTFQAIDEKYITSEINGVSTSGFKGAYYNARAKIEGDPALIRNDKQVNFSWGWASPGPGVSNRSYTVSWSGELSPPVSGEYKLAVSCSEGGYRLFINEELISDKWTVSSEDNFEASFAVMQDVLEVNLQKDEPVDIRLEFYKKNNKNQIRLAWEIPGNNSMDEAIKVAQEADAVLLFAGLSNQFEGGANDREDILLPEIQNQLIESITATNQNTAVVLMNGSAIGMPWIGQVQSLLEAYYPGQEGGNALTRVIFGEVNPSGKLPETFPVNLSDNPAHGNYPGDNHIVRYEEGVFIGYRHFDKHNIAPLFPFGHGLSYSSFEYKNLDLKVQGDSIRVSFDLENTGDVAGSEVVQLYVGDVESEVDRPRQELKAFKKIHLNSNDSEEVVLKIAKADLSFYSNDQMQWVFETGEFEFSVGSSSRDIRLTTKKIIN